MKKIYLYGILLLLILLLISTGILLRLLTPFTEKTIQSHVKITNSIGINLDQDKLYFGAMNPGNKAGRSINITSDKDAYVVIRKSGEMADWLYPNKNGFFLEKNTVADIHFVVKTPSNLSYGNYTGNITLQFYRPGARHFLN